MKKSHRRFIYILRLPSHLQMYSSADKGLLPAKSQNQQWQPKPQKFRTVARRAPMRLPWKHVVHGALNLIVPIKQTCIFDTDNISGVSRERSSPQQ
jgi:hypothetical protein